MPCGATQNGRVIVESSDKMWSTGEGNGKPLQYSCLENPMNSMKRQKDKTLKDELPRLVGAQYAIGDQWRNNSRKNEEMEPKKNQHTAVDVTGDGSKVLCCKEPYCIGTWNIRPTNQGKLITEEGFLISPCYSLELCIQMFIFFLFSFAFLLVFFSQLFVRPPQTAILLFDISFPWG